MNLVSNIPFHSFVTTYEKYRQIKDPIADRLHCFVENLAVKAFNQAKKAKNRCIAQNLKKVIPFEVAQEAFVAAIGNNDIAELQFFLKLYGKSIAEPEHLSKALERHSLAVARCLILDFGVNPKTSLKTAVEKSKDSQQDFEIIKLMLDRIDWNAPEKQDVLQVAIKSDKYHVIEWCIQYFGYKIDFQDSKGMTLLSKVIESENQNAIDFCKRNHANEELAREIMERNLIRLCWGFKKGELNAPGTRAITAGLNCYHLKPWFRKVLVEFFRSTSALSDLEKLEILEAFDNAYYNIRARSYEVLQRYRSEKPVLIFGGYTEGYGGHSVSFVAFRKWILTTDRNTRNIKPSIRGAILNSDMMAKEYFDELLHSHDKEGYKKETLLSFYYPQLRMVLKRQLIGNCVLIAYKSAFLMLLLALQKDPLDSQTQKNVHAIYKQFTDFLRQYAWNTLQLPEVKDDPVLRKQIATKAQKKLDRSQGEARQAWEEFIKINKFT